jgi:hypothetical protein
VTHESINGLDHGFPHDVSLETEENMRRESDDHDSIISRDDPLVVIQADASNLELS